MGQAQINVRTRACSTSMSFIARTKQAALTHHVRGKELVLCIVSMIRYDMYRRYIDTIHDTYRIIYSIQNIAETVIKNNIQTH